MVIHEECLGLMKERVESMSGGWAVRYVSASDKMKENAERKMQVYGGRGENMID
jgi:hypothetical protein